MQSNQTISQLSWFPHEKWYVHSFRYGYYLDNSFEDQNYEKKIIHSSISLFS